MARPVQQNLTGYLLFSLMKNHEKYEKNICDRLWENPAKVARQNSEKKGKSKKKYSEVP
jgi:hypothetical protein